MRQLKAAALFAGIALVGCNPDNLGFPVGDVRGIWTATLYEVTDNATGLRTLSLIAAGGTLTMAIDEGETGGVFASATFLDGAGGGWQRGGQVDIENATVTLDGILFSIDHDGNDMSLTTSATTWDFGSGEESASSFIELQRF